MKILLVFAIGIWTAGMAVAMESSQGKLTVTPMATGLDEPWGFGFLPNGGGIITERGGTIWFVDPNGKKRRVLGSPDVVDAGQGGLLDVMIPGDFPTTRQIYFTFAKKQGRGSGTAFGRGRLSENGRNLRSFETIFEMSSGSSGGRHFGSRLVEARDGSIFMTIGERGDRPSAQDLSRHNGSVLRLTRDGKPHPDNPFIGSPGALPEIWSFGHRNPQGATLDLDGRLVVNEHGAKGGDEINRIKKGANYGWPVIAYGRHYTGLSIGEGTEKPGMEQPDLYWDPSIAPSGLMIYSGKLWPDWKGDLFTGSLKFDMISRVKGGKNLQEVERISGPETGRVRDIREAPDGSIWFISVDRGAIFRITP